MKILDPITLVGQPFAVEGVDRMPESSPPGIVGTTLLGEQRILVRLPLGSDQERDTVLHEILHAILRLLGIGPTLTEQQEETVVALLAPTLLDALRRNPALVQYLLDG